MRAALTKLAATHCIPSMLQFYSKLLLRTNAIKFQSYFFIFLINIYHTFFIVNILNVILFSDYLKNFHFIPMHIFNMFLQFWALIDLHFQI